MTLRIQNKTNSTIHINNSDDWSTPIETTGYAILLFIIILMLFFAIQTLLQKMQTKRIKLII